MTDITFGGDAVLGFNDTDAIRDEFFYADVVGPVMLPTYAEWGNEGDGVTVEIYGSGFTYDAEGNFTAGVVNRFDIV